MGKVIWFTGLSGSGKTTIALKLKEELELIHKTVHIIDGDVIRSTLHSHLGFSRKDIKTNNRLIAKLAKTESKKFDYILIPIISPFEDDRKMAKSIIGKNNFIELYINTSLEVCSGRDVKGLYKKAFDGEIENFIGVSETTPYQPPTDPDLIINTEKMEVKENVKVIMDYLNKL